MDGYYGYNYGISDADFDDDEIGNCKYSSFTKEELICELKKKNSDIEAAKKALSLQGTRQFIINGKVLWLAHFDPAKPLPSDKELERMSEEYFNGNPVVLMPDGVSLSALSERDLESLGLSFKPTENSGRDSYDDMLKGRR